MGIGKLNDFNSVKNEYETPDSIFLPLRDEFDLELDLAASDRVHKLNVFYNEKQNALLLDWKGNCWLNPPFGRNLGKWIVKLCDEAIKWGGNKVCLIPVRSNTKWWSKVINKAEIRFIIGEVKFVGQENGLWLPMCILIFGDKAKVGQFSTIYFI